MRALIVGAGDVGYDIARMLSRQKLDVVVVDNDPAKIEHVRDTLDVQALLGSGTSALTLSEAGISRVGLMVAVTDVDEVNIVAAMLAEAAAQRAGRACTTIARVRSGEFSEKNALLKLADFGIDHLIHPEQSAANEAVALLQRAAATDVVEFVGGKLQLVGIRIDPDSPVVGLALKEIAQRASHLPFRVMGISRGVRTLVPDGDVRIQKNDQVFVLVQSGQAPQVAHVLGKSGARLEHVMILGGSKVGALIAQRLCAERKRKGGAVSIKIVEPDRQRAEWLAERIEGAMVIHGDPSDIDLLVVEGIQETDAVVAVSQDEESNLVVCLMAKHLGVKKTVALLSKSAYVPISQAIGLDAAVSQKLAVSREVLRFLRGAHIRSVATVHGLDAEILEVEAGEGSPITKRPLMELKLPRGLLVGAVVGRRVEIATGQTHVEPGQRAIVFATPQQVDEVEKWFGR